MGTRRSLKRRVRRHRRWWPYWLSLGGALVIAGLNTVRAEPVDEGILGPVIAGVVIAGLAGLLIGVAEGFVQPPAPTALRIRLVLVILALLVAAGLRGDPWGSFLSSLGGAAAGLGLRWCGERAVNGLLGKDDDDG